MNARNLLFHRGLEYIEEPSVEGEKGTEHVEGLNVRSWRSPEKAFINTKNRQLVRRSLGEVGSLHSPSPLDIAPPLHYRLNSSNVLMRHL